MRAFIYGLAVLIMTAGSALAQSEPENDRFCLVPSGGENPAPERCKFASLRDCEAAKRSEAESCVPNPSLTFPQPADKPGLPDLQR